MAETVRIEIPIEVTDNTDPELSNITDSLEDVDMEVTLESYKEGGDK